MLSSEAKVKIKNSFEKPGLMRTRASVRANLIVENDCFASLVHLISLSFLRIFVMCLTISAKFGINLLKKIIFPKND